MPDIDHYVVQLRNGANTTTIQTHTVDAASFTTTFEDLAPGTAYKVRIFSQAAGVLSSTPKVLSITTEGTGGEVPGTPDGISYHSDASSITVDDIAAGVGPTPDHYMVFLMNQGFTSILADPQTVTLAELPVVFPALNPLTYYGIRVVAIKGDQYSTGASDTVVQTGGDFAFVAPGEPTGLTKTADGGTTATISWTAPAELGNPPMDYYFWTLERSADLETMGYGEVTSTHVDLTGLAPGTTYSIGINSANTYNPDVDYTGQSSGQVYLSFTTGA